ncbi:hypothetical protein BDF19DRAFT_155176 [Syncephalis fuscata]|nr:hypothetical protein BDF19DRAFT_155176 [Syncephalis fuscata]
MDPRTVDLWKVGETVYAAQYGLYPLKEKMYLEPIVNDIFSKMPDVQPELGNTQEQFRRFMAHFNKFIKENYKSGLTTTNNDRAVVLNTSGGIIGHSIGASSSPLKQISLTPEIMNLLIVAQHKVFGNNDFQIYSKFLLNGFFRLGIYCRVSSKHIRSLNLYAPIFDMLNKLLAINSKERLTPNQYLEQIDRNANANRLHASV